MISVALHVSSLDSLRETQHTFTDSNSRFQFESVGYSPDNLYGLSTIYKGVVYVSDITIESGIAIFSSISVYDTSTDDESIFLSKGSFSITGIDNLNRKISILELATISNNSQLTYVQGSGPMDLIRFGIPEGATNFLFDTLIPAAEYIQVDKGFALIASLPPGSHEIMYSYDIPYNGQQAEVVKSWRYGVENASILYPTGTVNINTDFETKSQDTIGGKAYTIFESKNIAKGAKTTIVLNDLPTPKFLNRISNQFGQIHYEYTGPIGLLLVLISIGSIGIFSTIRLRNRRESWLAGSSESQVILDQIAELDRRVSEDNLDNRLYIDRRDYLVKRLQTISEETEVE
tara:strand:- start:664 stop:1701 length:1038 start_codon:yes stop_codon:yes gene_type:complete